MAAAKREYSIGQIVYLRTDPEQHHRMVTAITESPNGITYGLSLGNEQTWHYHIEISPDRDMAKLLAYES